MRFHQRISEITYIWDLVTCVWFD
uniref:Uncharacterized protein n=1 Tax=Anguilla anguilla TaxID=7936 RepID=A0A0E9V9H4_ANGAN